MRKTLVIIFLTGLISCSDKECTIPADLGYTKKRQAFFSGYVPCGYEVGDFYKGLYIIKLREEN